MDLMEKRIQQELTRLDPNLFLDKLWDQRGFVYYAVRYPLGDGTEPLVCGELRDAEGPIPLSPDIVTQIAAQEHDVREAMASAIAANDAKKLARRIALDESLDETAKDFERSQGRT